MSVIVERRIPPVNVALIAVTLTLSIAAAIDWGAGGGLYQWLALRPEAVWRGEVWRLATWPFVIGGPLPLIVACVALYVFGSDLAFAWGRRRYFRYVGGVVLVAGIGTSLVALALPFAWELPYLGGMVLVDSLAIAWARAFPDRPVTIYFVLLVHGRGLVAVIVAATLIFAAFFGIAWMLPELLAVAIALLYGNRSLRRAWLNLKLLWVRRKLHVVRDHAEA